MKALTLNTWQERGPWRERWDIICRWIEAEQPDIIGFQEIFNPEWPHQVQKLTGYPYAAKAAAPFGLVTMSRFPVKEMDLIKFKTKSPSEDYDRFALFARLERKGKPLFVFNTHLSWMLHEDPIREKQVSELLGLAERLSDSPEVLVMGDFNAPPGSRAIAAMTGQGDFVDVYGELYPAAEVFTWSHKNPYTKLASGIDGAEGLPERRLDYIFVKRGSELSSTLKSVEIVMDRPDGRGFWASDHFGVFASFGE